MNGSVRRQLFVGLSVSILLAGLVAAVVSFAISYEDANELQDAQLAQVAATLSNVALGADAAQFEPRSEEEAETHFVVRLLGSPPSSQSPQVDLWLPVRLRPGMQSIEQSGVRWRVVVAQNAAGQRFAVAQRVTLRDEVARRSALLALLPSLLLIPVLLVIVGVVLRKAFAPMAALSAAVDRLEGGRLVPLDERRVPFEALPLVQAFNRLMTRLGHVLEQQRRLVSDAAHELRTPLATLIVQADNVGRVALPAEAAARMGLLRRGLAQMSSLIDQLLSFARVQGTAPALRQRLEVAALVRTAIEENLPRAEAKGVDLGCLHVEPVAAIAGDPLHAYALVRNVIDNAVRYTPAGGAVDVSVALANGEVVLVVEDSGPGIHTADIERVFEPFVRVLGNDEPGSGLGLAIARTSAQALGGRIELANRTDGGSGLRVVYRQACA